MDDGSGTQPAEPSPADDDLTRRAEADDEEERLIELARVLREVTRQLRAALEVIEGLTSGEGHARSRARAGHPKRTKDDRTRRD